MDAASADDDEPPPAGLPDALVDGLITLHEAAIPMQDQVLLLLFQMALTHLAQTYPPHDVARAVSRCRRPTRKLDS